MTLKKRQQMIVDFLKEEGFEASVTEHGDVEFLHDGEPLYIILTEGDDSYLQILLPAFCSLKGIEDKENIYEAIFNINASFKVANIVVLEDLVYASVELFCSPMESFKFVFRDSFEVILTVANEFLELWGEDDDDDDSDDEEEENNPN